MLKMTYGRRGTAPRAPARIEGVMSLEETIQFLNDSASRQEARLAQLEENNRRIQRLLARLVEGQKALEFAIEQTWNLLEEMQDKPVSLRRNARRPILKSKTQAKDHLVSHHTCRPARRPRRPA